MKNMKSTIKKAVAVGAVALTVAGTFGGVMATGTTRAYAADGAGHHPQVECSLKVEKNFYTDWMDQIKDDTRLIDMNIPGSHDSGTFGVSTVPLKTQLGRAQEKNIKEQLEAGVRAFDLRYKMDSDGEYYIYHGDSAHGAFSECTCYTSYSACTTEKLSVKAVMDDFQAFLKQHPSETIIVTWAFEGNKDEADRRDDVGMMKLFDSYKAVALFNRDKEKSEEKNYSEYMNTKSLKEVTLHDLRGKIVICNDMFDYNNAVDRSNNWNATVDEKIADIQFYVKNAPVRGTQDFTPMALRTSISGRNAWVYDPNEKDFSTLDYIKGTTYSIRDQKNAIAEKMKNIEFRSDRIYGVVLFDYVTKEDTSSIIHSNPLLQQH